jgi:hypothetical protein
MPQKHTSRLILISMIALAALAGAPAVAGSHQMTIYSCHDPAGNAVGHDGWSAERYGSGGYVTLTDGCAASGEGTLLAELGGRAGGYNNLESASWVFRAPWWANIAHYTIQVAASYTYPWHGSGEGQAFVDASDESDPQYDYRALSDGSIGSRTISVAPTAPVSWITVNASCDGEIGPCPGATLIAQINVSSAAILLDDSTTPTVSNLSGSLVSGSPARGTAEVSFDAADSGPGIYSGQLVIDGQPLTPVVLNANNGSCQNLGETADGTRAFAHPEPCAKSTSGSLTLDTTSLSDGAHTLKVIVDDASGNAVTAFNGSITTDNAPSIVTAPTISGLAQVGSTLTATDGTFSLPSGAGSLSATTGQWMHCDAAGEKCSPIAGATSSTYTPVADDIHHTILYQDAASDKTDKPFLPPSQASR